MEDTKRKQSSRLSNSRSNGSGRLGGTNKSGRQPIIPAKEASKSQRSAIKRPKAIDPKASRKTDVIKPQKAGPSNRISPIKQSTKRIPSESKTQNTKSKQSTVGTRTSRAKAPAISASNPSGKASSRASGKISKSGRNSSRSSGKNASRGGSTKGKEQTLHFIVVGGLVLLIIIFAVFKFGGSSNTPPKRIYNFDAVTAGFMELEEAKKLYKASDMNGALGVYNSGMNKINTYLDKERNSNGDLPKNLAGYESKLALWNGFGKMLREQALIERNQH